MNERYPNATEEDLTENDNICIICREEMTVQADNNSSDVPKKLRCGHIFHLRCLKSWLERQQSCPTWYVLYTTYRILYIYIYIVILIK